MKNDPFWSVRPLVDAKTISTPPPPTTGGVIGKLLALLIVNAWPVASKFQKRTARPSNSVLLGKFTFGRIMDMFEVGARPFKNDTGSFKVTSALSFKTTSEPQPFLTFDWKFSN